MTDEKIREAFDAWRSQLEQIGVGIEPAPLAQVDQVRQSYRSDLVALGVDPGDHEQLAATFAGFAVATRAFIQAGHSAPCIAGFVRIALALLPMLDMEPVALDTLPEMDFLTDLNFDSSEPHVEPAVTYACSMCGGSDDVVGIPVPWGAIAMCVKCRAQTQVAGQDVPPQIRALAQEFVRRLNSPGAMRVMQIGGPGFNRPSDAPEMPVEALQSPSVPPTPPALPSVSGVIREKVARWLLREEK